MSEQNKQEPVAYAEQSILDWLADNARGPTAYAKTTLAKRKDGKARTALYTTPLTEPAQEPVAWPQLSKNMEHAAQEEFHILPPRLQRLWKRMQELYTTPPNVATPLAAPVQEPVAWVREHELPLAPGDAFSWVETFVHKTPLYMHPEPAAPVQEPWGACVYGRVFVGKLPEHARKFSEDEGVPIQWLYATPPAAQRKWVELTDEEALTEAARHLGEMHVENCGLSDIKDFARAIEAKLREKNGGVA